MFAKALASNADCLILDLEDAVAVSEKEKTRQVVAEWLTEDFGQKERIVRINPLDSQWCKEDIQTTFTTPPDSYLIPKVSHLNELVELDQIISKQEQHHGVAVGSVGMIVIANETPLGALNLAQFTQCKRVVGLTWGAEDLSAALGATGNRDEQGRYLPVFEYCRSQTLLCAAAGGVSALDGVFVDLKDTSGLQTECAQARAMGFSGKLTIHPDQIDIVNAAFTPSEDELAQAKALLDAYAEAESQGKGAFQFEGQMVDMPHVQRARALLRRAGE